MAKNLFTLTVKTTQPADSELLVGGTGSANAYNFTWTKLKEWLFTNISFPGTVTFANGIQEYLFTDRSTLLAIQGQSSSTTTGVELFTKDGDGTDNLVLRLWAKGIPSALTDIEYLSLDYDNTGEFRLSSLAGGSGTVRPLVLFTGLNTDQLKLNIDGTILTSTMPTASGGLASGTLWANSNVINIIP